MENILAGGFTSFRKFDAEEKGLFDQVLTPILGAQHLPLAVATQVVNGTNLAFLCDSKAIYPDAPNYNTLVIIHQPLPHVNEAPRLLEIKTVKII